MSLTCEKHIEAMYRNMVSTETKTCRMPSMSTVPGRNGFFKPTEWGASTTEIEYGFWRNGHSCCDFQVTPGGGSQTGTLTLPAGMTADNTNIALRAASNISKQKAEFAESLLEGKSTLAMVATRAKQVAAVVGAARQRDIKGVVSALGLPQVPKRFKNRYGRIPGKGVSDSSNLFLEFQFGWMPLFQDIATINDLFINGLVKSKSRGSIVRGMSSHVYQNTTELVRWDQGLLRGKAQRSVKWDAKCVVTYKLMDFDTVDMLNVYGLGDPISIAYNATPLSFVADWFLPLGDLIGALNSTRNAVYLDGYVSHKYKAEWVGVTPPSHYKPQSYYWIKWPSQKYWDFYRALIINDPAHQIPKPTLGLNSNTILTSIALMAQRSRL